MGDDHKRAGAGEAKGGKTGKDPSGKDQSGKDQSGKDTGGKDTGGKDLGNVIRKDTDVKSGRPAQREKDVVTEGSEDSFPASDPPSYMAGSAVSGSPPSRKSDEPDEDDLPPKK